MINEEDDARRITSIARRQLACKRIAKEKEMKQLRGKREGGRGRG